MPILIHETGTLKGQAVRIDPDRLYTIGREEDCDVPLLDELVSRVHARLRGKDGRYFIKDDHSSNGTFVNDQPIAPTQELQSGDKLSLGTTILTFLSDADAGGGAGRTLGGYKLLQRLGRGGMGTVYRALQLSLNREVALKILSPELSRDPTFVERFLKEARSAGQLNHPNIVQVYDVDRDDGLTFYAMEFVAGGTVEDLISKQGKIDLEAALAYLADATRGLQYAELKKIVHRDIKPDNLMLTELGTLKVADLGLALAVHEGQAESAILGTPHFISPEQAKCQTLDTRSDLYSLGATFYRMLTGSTMFHGKQAQEIVRQQVKADPPSLREQLADTPEAVESLFQRLVKKDPAERFQSCTELLKEIEAVQAGTGSRKLLFVGLAIILPLVAAVVYFGLNNGQADREREVITTPAGSSDTNELEERMVEQGQQLERTRRENDALTARLQLDRVAADYSKDELFQALNKLAAEHPDTEAGSKASARAQELANEIAAERQTLLARAAQVESAVNAMETAAVKALEQQHFADAFLALLGSGDIPEDLSGDPRLKIARERLGDRIRMQLDEKARSLLEAARTALANQQFDQARTSIGGARLLTDGSGRLPETATVEREQLAGLDAAMNQLRSDVDTAEREYRRGLLTTDLRRLRQACDWSALHRAERELDFRSALSALEQLKGQMVTEEYRNYLELRAADLRCATEDVERFLRAADNGQLKNDEMAHPERNVRATIKGLSSERDGVLLQVSKSGGTASSVVRFEAFNSMEACLGLLENRVERTPQQRLCMVRAGLALAGGHLHLAIQTLKNQIQVYDAAAGWSTAQQQALAALVIPTHVSEKLDLLLESVQQQAPELSDEIAGLKARIEREEEALRLFEQALVPFRQATPSSHFAEAASNLEQLISSYSDTDFFLVAYDVFDGGQAAISLID